MVPQDRARVFFALWPDDDVREALARTAASAQAECGGRATAAARIHLTLFFVGDVDRSEIPMLQTCARGVPAKAFELTTEVLGYWRHNRIVWAGVRAIPRELSELVSSLTAAMAATGYRGEDRPYVPHATLVRNARHEPCATAIDAPPWRARDLVLVESAGGRYEVLSRFAFEPPV